MASLTRHSQARSVWHLVGLAVHLGTAFWRGAQHRGRRLPDKCDRGPLGLRPLQTQLPGLAAPRPLRPATAAARHCLSTACLGTSSSTEWTMYDGWLGSQDGHVGVGIAGTGTLAAKVFAHTPVPQKWLVYAPTPKPVTLAGMRHGPNGTYIAVVTGAP